MAPEVASCRSIIAQAALAINRVRTGKRRRHALAGYVLSAPLQSALADHRVRAPEARCRTARMGNFRADRTRPLRPQALLEPHAAVLVRKTVWSRPFIRQIRHVVQAVAHFLATACPSGPPAHRKPECPLLPLSQSGTPTGAPYGQHFRITGAHAESSYHYRWGPVSVIVAIGRLARRKLCSSCGQNW